MYGIAPEHVYSLKAIGFLGVFALVVNLVYNNLNFFKLPKPQKEVGISLILVVKAFCLFLVSSLIIIPSIASLWLMINNGEAPQKVSPYVEGWLHLSAIVGTVVLFSIFIILLGKEERRTIFGASSKWISSLILGIFTWFVAYPTMLFIGNSLSWAIRYFTGEDIVDQVAVEQLKSSLKYPLQHQLMSFAVIIIVPILEELLFRGFLQSWLRQQTGRISAIIICSIVFALFHYSTKQGITNIQILPSLFVLSCYLGFLRERQQTVWASVGLHGFFNGMSIMMLHFTK